MKQKQMNALIQKAMNDAGVKPKFSLTGNYGPQTERETDNFEFTITAVPKKVIDLPTKPSATGYFGAPWVGVNIDLLGRHESDPELNRRYVPRWAKVGLPGYKSLEGNARAWCAIMIIENLAQAGVNVKGLNAGAYSLSKWGKKCPFWFGAGLDIKHGKNGGRHVCFFLYWIDEKKKIAATLDGNRGNRFCVARTDLSGSHDYLVAGPRWGSEVPDGQFVSMAEVLAAYPYLKVGGSGSASTR